MIEDLNKQYSQINSVSCRLSSLSSVSDLYYEKPNKVLLRTYFLGKEELKVSSDGQNYWFWIRNFDPKSVYYSLLSELESTRVIDPLKPDLIKSLLFIDEIPLENTTIQNEDSTQIYFLKGSYYLSLTIRDGKVKEQHWFSLKNEPILSIYFIKGDIIPTLIRLIWHQQDYDAKIAISEVKINPKQKPNYEAPSMKKINLKDY